MLLKYRATESYYEGFQKANLFADRTVRICAVIFFLFGGLVAPLRFFIPSGFKWESVFTAALILYVFPLSTSLIGGMSKTAWKLYAGFGIFFLSGLVPALWGQPGCLVLILPAICFLVLLFRAEPKILRRFGYSGKTIALSEILIMLLSSGIFFLFTYLTLVMVRKSEFVPQMPLHYLLQFLIVVPKYFVAWGILYGVLMKHLLDLKLEPFVPIYINILLNFAWWACIALNAEDPGVIIAGLFVWSIAVHLILGMAYYYTRTTRPLLLAFGINSIIFVASSTM